MKFIPEMARDLVRSTDNKESSENRSLNETIGVFYLYLTRLFNNPSVNQSELATSFFSLPQHFKLRQNKKTMMLIIESK